MPQHSANEQYLLELINAERAKAKVQPLAFDNDLSEAAEGHSRWMIATDTFSHTGSGGSSSTQRMKAAGYTFSGSWASGENIAWATTRAPAGYQDEVKLLHTNLMNSSGHRANLLNPNFHEIGLGFEVGDYRGRSSTFLTEDFAKSGSDLFLTGVAFDDRDGDRFYDPGEGLKGITVTAKTSAGAIFKTTTMNAGGYDLVLKSGTYTVTFSGPDIATSSQTVTIGTKNVKRDLIDPVTTPSLAAKTAQETAPETTSGSAPASNASPASETQGDGLNAVTAAWLARFLVHEWDSGASNGTLPTFEKGGAVAGSTFHGRLPAALSADQLRFKQLGEDKISNLFGHEFPSSNDDHRAAAGDADLHGALRDIPAVDSAFAILAQAASASHSDLLI